ncbi:EAL-associated domain-containing protein [Lentibacillus sp. N15]|uniref:EAL-associated domain-containing protein n=1 Tax=Lentibacillus songyuanensis TaxID=3136161 RepID=UPI0031BBB5B9
MDALDIMLHLEQVIPYYQPIVRADTQLVVGYEVIPVLKREKDVQELSGFFNDSNIPVDFLLDAYNDIQRKVLNQFMQSDQSTLLFFPYEASVLLDDNGQQFLSLLQSYLDNGLDVTKIIMQIKETPLADQMDALNGLFTYMKSLGIGIAIDNVGQRIGNLDRLAVIEPTVIKVDTSFLKDDLLPHLYRDVHHSISMLSRKIGATLMFKGISTYQQLNYAWRNGGQFYQGGYIQKAQPTWSSPDCCKERMTSDFQHFVNFERKKMKAQLELSRQINAQFDAIWNSLQREASYDEMVLSIGQACNPFAFRVYLCNEEGIQLSSNAEKNTEGAWELHYEGRHKNWSWRPYFFENIIRMNVEKKGILSDLYTDIDRDELIRTYAYPLSEERYVFLDIPYDYLVEQEALL